MILAACTVTVLETEETLVADRAIRRLFQTLDLCFVVFFSVEYALRIWAAGEIERFRGPLGRLRYAVQPMSVIDFLAIVPFFLTLGGSDLVLLRILRFMRILILARLGGFTIASRILFKAVAERTFELAVSAAVAFTFLMAAAIALYFAEGPYQPEHFGSIPRAMWWSMATLTTVGYGDTYPITALGKVLAGITALAGIGVIAMPAGILAAAFSDAFQKRKERRTATSAGQQT